MHQRGVMSSETSETTEKRLTPAARRILEVASELFYRRGLHAVGVDTIAAESGITKRTLYDRFGSKDALIVAYLQARDRRWRDLVAARLHAAHDAVARVLVPFDALSEWLAPGSRGCCFVNAFAELPEPEHPARQIGVAEKKWLRDLFHELLTDAGATDPDELAVQLLSLHEGAIVSYSIADEPHAAAAARAAAKTLIAHHLHPPNSHTSPPG